MQRNERKKGQEKKKNGSREKKEKARLKSASGTRRRGTRWGTRAKEKGKSEAGGYGEQETNLGNRSELMGENKGDPGKPTEKKENVDTEKRDKGNTGTKGRRKKGRKGTGRKEGDRL